MPFYCTRLLPAAVLLIGASLPLSAQSSSSQTMTSTPANTAAPVAETMAHNPWNWGAFFTGGFSADVTPSSSYLNLGARAGKVMTGPIGPGFLRGQFEYSAELMPWWQARTDTFERVNLTATSNPNVAASSGPYKTGGAYNGISVTPILLRWDLSGSRRIMPFVQGGGGVVWTNHKYPAGRTASSAGTSGHKCLELYPAVWRGLPVLPQTPALNYLQCERGAHF